MKMDFNIEDWPKDGSDWDGIHDETMKQILENLEHANTWNRFFEAFAPVIPLEQLPFDDNGEYDFKKLTEIIKLGIQCKGIVKIWMVFWKTPMYDEEQFLVAFTSEDKANEYVEKRRKTLSKDESLEVSNYEIEK